MSAPRTVQQLFDLSGRTAFVTGGSRGLGLRLDRARWARPAPRVTLTTRKAATPEGAARSLRDVGIDAVWEVSDASDDAQVAALVVRASERHGRVDILVNSAGEPVPAVRLL